MASLGFGSVLWERSNCRAVCVIDRMSTALRRRGVQTMRMVLAQQGLFEGPLGKFIDIEVPGQDSDWGQRLLSAHERLRVHLLPQLSTRSLGIIVATMSPGALADLR